MTSQKHPAAILFDLDGTLVDSLPDIAGALGTLFNEMDREPLSSPEVKAMIGGGIPMLIERALTAGQIEVDGEQRGKLTQRFRDIYSARATELTRPFPGVVELLGQMKDAGTRLGVCTNKPEAVSRQILDELELSQFIGAVIGGDTLPTRKPDAAPVLAGLEILGCSPARGLMVGDSDADSGAARAAGVPVILVSFGYTRTPVAEIDADAVIDTFAELPNAIASVTGTP